MDEFLAEITDELDGFKEACSEIVRCNCSACQVWLSMRRGDPDIQATQFVDLCGQIHRMMDDERIDEEQFCDADCVLSLAVEACSDEVIAWVCDTAERAMRETLAAPGLN